MRVKKEKQGIRGGGPKLNTRTVVFPERMSLRDRKKGKRDGDGG